MENFEERYTGPKSEKRFASEMMGKLTDFWGQYQRIRLNDNDVVWEVEEIPIRSGWIVGLGRVYEGKHVSASHTAHIEIFGAFVEDYDPPYLAVEKSVPHVLICPWPRHKPVRVPFDHFRLNPEAIPHNNGLWDERSKKIMREESQLFPRDEKGRFC